MSASARRVLGLVVVWWACALVACSRGAPALHGVAFDPPRAAADFGGTNWDGTPFHLSDQRGRLTVVFFGYTYCPDICPVTLSKMKTLYHQLGDRAQEVAVVFVSVDPERDSLEKLSHYVPAFDPHFFGVRLEPAELAAAIAAYDVTAVKRYTEGERLNRGRDSYSIDHTGAFFVIDGAGMLRLRYAFEAPVDDMLADIRSLAGDDAGLQLAALPEPKAQRRPDGTAAASTAMLTIDQAVAHPSGGTTAGTAVYLTILNRGDAADRLVAVATPAAREASMHETAAEGVVMRMIAHPDGFEIPPREAVRLAPAGKHIMLMDLAKPLAVGDAIDLTLRFDKAGPISIRVPVDEVTG